MRNRTSLHEVNKNGDFMRCTRSAATKQDPLRGPGAYNICGNKICQKVLARATWRSLSGEAVIIIIMKSIIQMEKFLMKIPDGKAENSEHVPQSMSKEKVADLDAVKACNSPPHKGV